MRSVVAFAALALAGTLISQPDPALAGGMRGSPGGFRAPVFAPRLGRPGFFHHPHRGLAGRRIIAPSPGAYGYVSAARPYGTVSTSRSYGTTDAPRAARRFANIGTNHLTRRHHRAYHTGWGFPVTVIGDEAGYIGQPYDPAEVIPVYGPAPGAQVTDVTDQPTASPTRTATPRVSDAAEANPDACRSEKVTVPAAEGEREITLVRC